MLSKPGIIAVDGFQSRKWDELTAGRDFADSDIPDLMTLCAWYAVLDQCMREIGAGGATRVAYLTGKGEVRPMPQIATMKQASAEIRALRKALYPTAATRVRSPHAASTPLAQAMSKRKMRLIDGGKTEGKTGT